MSTKSNALTRRFGAVKTSAGLGVVIILSATLISCVSSFMIYKEGFTDLPQIVGVVASLLAVVLVEGAFGWLLYSFTNAFSSQLERILAFAGIAFLVCVMLVNVTTHYQMVKGKALHPFQHAWLDWAAVTVFLVIMCLTIAIKLCNPITRLRRLEIRAAGRELEAELAAKLEAMDSETVYNAMARRAEIEAGLLAQRIIGNAAGPVAGPAAITAETDKRVEGFARYRRNIGRGNDGGK